jgi:hypothetical protein
MFLIPKFAQGFGERQVEASEQALAKALDDMKP